MKTLIDNLIAILNTAITGGTLSVTKIFKGLQNAPEQAGYTEFPYLMVDDGGEFTDIVDPDSTRAQNRTYNIVLEIGCYNVGDLEACLDQVLDISSELKTILETTGIKIAGSDSDQEYEFVWGIEITPFGYEQSGSYFRGRQIIVQFVELEDTIDRY